MMGTEPRKPSPSVAARRRLRMLRVYVTLFQVLASVACFQLQRRVRGETWAAAARGRFDRANARRVVGTIGEVRGLFIKVGQLVSMLAGVLPEDFRDQLEAVQDRIPPRPWSEIEARLAAELGTRAQTAFRSIEPEPIASASLAQVHRARLADGRDVAVKVQHLDIERLAEIDLATVRRVLAIVSLVTRARGLDALFAEVRGMIEDELDFAREAEHVAEIAAQLEDDPMVCTPEVIRDLSTSRVLVTSFVDATKVSDTDSLDALGVDRAALAERILHAYCRMMFEGGIYHADPHPGNILVRDDGGVVFLDFGAVARVSPAMKAGIPTLLEGVVRRDREGIARALRQLGFLSRRPGDDVAERLIDYVYSRFLESIDFSTWNLEEVHFDLAMKMELMADLERLDLSLHDLTASFQIPREWILLFRTLVLLLGVCTRLDPAMRPVAVARPYLEEVVLGQGRDWLRLVRTMVQDLAMSAVTLPGDMRRLVSRAEKGRLAMEVGGLRESATLLYALGHQLLFGLAALGAGGMAYVAHGRGDARLVQTLLAAAAVLALLAVRSMWKMRIWSRRLRRGAPPG